MNKCNDCHHYFTPRMMRMTIDNVWNILRGCQSETVWIVHNGRRYALHSFGLDNHSWTGKCFHRFKILTLPVTLSVMLRALKYGAGKHVDNYRLRIHIEAGDKWVHVSPIEENLPSGVIEDMREEVEGEILIHVHNKDDVLAAYKKRFDKPEQCGISRNKSTETHRKKHIMNIFDWDEVRPKFYDKQATRDATIKAAFQQYIDGNECYDDMKGAELRGLFAMFRTSWIICEHVLRGSHG